MGLARSRTPWIGVSYRSWLTIRPSRKPVSSAKDRLQIRRIARLCARGRGRSEDTNRRWGRGRWLPMVLVGLRRLLSPSDGGNRLLPQPVGQRPATKALHEVGALAQPPAGRGRLIAHLASAGGLLQRPGSDRCRHRDQRQLTRSPLGSGPHFMSPIASNNRTGWGGGLGAIAVAG